MIYLSNDSERIEFAQSHTTQFVDGLEAGLEAGFGLPRVFLYPRTVTREEAIDSAERTAYQSNELYPKLTEALGDGSEKYAAYISGMQEGVVYAINKRFQEESV